MATTNINVRVDSALKQEFEVKRPTPNAETKTALDEYEEMEKIRINTSVTGHLMKF